MARQQSYYSHKVSGDFLCMHYTFQQCFTVIAPAFRLSWTSSNTEYMETYVFTLAIYSFIYFVFKSTTKFTQSNQYLPIQRYIGHALSSLMVLYTVEYIPVTEINIQE